MLQLFWCQWSNPLHWRHNERDGFSNHRHTNYLLNRLFRCRSKKTSNLASPACVMGIHRWHKGPVNREMFPFDDVIMRELPSTKTQQNISKCKPCTYLNGVFCILLRSVIKIIECMHTVVSYWYHYGMHVSSMISCHLTWLCIIYIDVMIDYDLIDIVISMLRCLILYIWSWNIALNVH